MTLPSDLRSLVSNLATALDQATYFEEKATKVRAEAVTLRASLRDALDKVGFPEETIELLLAAR